MYHHTYMHPLAYRHMGTHTFVVTCVDIQFANRGPHTYTGFDIPGHTGANMHTNLCMVI